MSPPVFHPAPEALSLSEPLFGFQPVYLLWRGWGASPSTAEVLTQVSLLAALFLVALFLYARRAGLPPVAAALGAFVATFGAPRSAQSEHLLMFGQAPSLAAVATLFVALGEVSSRRGRAAVLATWTLAAAQLWCGIYITWLSALVAALAVLFSLLFRDARAAWTRTLRRDRPAWIVGPLLALSLAAPLMPAFARRMASQGGEDRGRIERMQPLLASWLNPGEDHLLWGGTASRLDLAPAHYAWEHSLGLGLATTLLACGGAVLVWRSSPLRPILLAAAAAILLTLRWPGDASAWPWVLPWLPGATAIRAIGRIGVVLLPVWGLAVAWAFAWLAKRRWNLVLGLMALLIVIEPLRLRAVSSSVVLDRRAASLAEAVRAGACRAFLVSPWIRPPRSVLAVQNDAMFAALQSGVPTLNGYSSYAPTGWDLRLSDPRRPEENVKFLARTREWLDRYGLDASEVCWVRADLDLRPPRIQVLRLDSAWRDGTPVPRPPR